MSNNVYQLEFEICSLIYLFAISWHFFSSKKFKNNLTTIFFLVLVSSFLSIILDIIGSIAVIHINEVPIWVNYLINNAFYMIQTFIPTLMMTYTLYSAGYNYKENKKARLFLIPSFLVMLVNISNPFTHLIFEIKEVTTNSLLFVNGALYYTIYGSAIFYLVLVLFLALILKKKLRKNEFWMMISYIVLVSIAMSVQIFYPSLLLTGTAITLSITLMMFTIQNPEDMVDAISRTFNYNALVLYLSDKNKKHSNLHLVVVDIEGIGPVNRAQGLKMGNDLIYEASSFLQSLPHVWLFRVISSRFLFIVEKEEDQKKVIRAINRRFRSPFKVLDNSFNLDANAFSFTTPANFDSPIDLLMFIDLTYDNAQTNASQFKNEIGSEFLHEIGRRKTIEAALISALKNNDDELYMNYQPIYDSKTRKIVCAEALLRLNSNVIGFVSPADFIPIAEKCGLAPEIDAFVLNKCLKFLEENVDIPSIHINLSGAEFFENPSARIMKTINKYNVAPERITFEITETSATKYPELLEEFMKEMIEYGFHFAVDDFGTGFANITQIINLPFSTVKLDKVLLDENEKSRLLLESLLDTFGKLKLQTVVEGVETIEEYNLVNDLNATFIQGFLFSKPLIEADYLKLLKKD